MKRIAEVKKRVRSGQSPAQLLAREAHAAYSREIMLIPGRVLVKKAIRVLQSVLAESPLENPDSRFILARVCRCGQQFEPDRIQSETPQSEHPLQRHGIIAAALGIFRRKPAAEKDSHAGRIACPGFPSSARCAN